HGAVGATPDIPSEEQTVAALRDPGETSSKLSLRAFQEGDTGQATPDQSCAPAICAALVFALSTVLARCGIVSVSVIFLRARRRVDGHLLTPISAHPASAVPRSTVC